MSDNHITTAEYAEYLRTGRLPGEKCQVVDIKSSLEDCFQARIMDIANDQGWWAYHSYETKRSRAGFLDLFMVRGKWLLLWELKTMTGKVSTKQQELIDLLEKVENIDVRVCRPSDIDEMTRIIAAPEQVLKERTK